MQLLSNYGATKSCLCAIYHVEENVKGMLTTDLILFINRKTAILKTHSKIPKGTHGKLAFPGWPKK